MERAAVTLWGREIPSRQANQSGGKSCKTLKSHNYQQSAGDQGKNDIPRERGGGGGERSTPLNHRPEISHGTKWASSGILVVATAMGLQTRGRMAKPENDSPKISEEAKRVVGGPQILLAQEGKRKEAESFPPKLIELSCRESSLWTSSDQQRELIKKNETEFNSVRNGITGAKGLKKLCLNLRTSVKVKKNYLSPKRPGEWEIE